MAQDSSEQPTESSQAFDLNIDRVLQHWTVPFAVRELIANALDEATLTGTADPVIEQDDDGHWHIRDFGRGLRYGHLTQNESHREAPPPRRRRASSASG